MAGSRCLNVGTADGFWAFAMERRGAGEVLAIDTDARDSDVPPHLRRGSPRDREGRRPGDNFRVLAGLLGSKAEFRVMSVYDLTPDGVGTFDLVFVGYVLHQLRDPLRALEAVRGICRGSVIVLDQILPYWSLISRQPLASIGARRDFAEWFTFNAAGLRRVVEFAGFRVSAVSPYLAYRRGPGVRRSDLSLGTLLRYSLGRAACSLAVRGEPA